MDELLQEVGFTEDELAELTEYQNTVKNLETVIQDEVMSIVYDEDTGEPKSAMVPPERFIEFMDNHSPQTNALRQNRRLLERITNQKR